MIDCFKKALVIVVISLICLIEVSEAGNKKTNIVVLTSDNLISTKRTLHGAKKVILQKHPDVLFKQFHLEQFPENDLPLIDSVKQIHPRVILTIGSSATKLAKENFKNIPIVFSAVKYPVLSGFVNSVLYPGRNITGASLDIPNDIQFKYLKKIIPHIKKIGVLYTRNTESLIPSAQVIAQQLGLQLIAIKVNSDRELPHALDSLANSVQAIWSVADPNLFKPKSTRYILLNTLRKRIPFMGFSRYVVESGALFALDFDYKAVGIQAGAIVDKILSGIKPEDIQVTTADVIWFHYNENTAKRINITIPKELAAVAKEVYR